ncbi:divalent cation transporter [Hydrogenophaga sp. PAMC20947]|uniref:ZIP family metal transporter n=1 Tax=Hydrogenophaga sp. PAMC20947 TaxID=2565558 RepID=UPI00109DF075|nr:divalent cation transporter [Hydrogenophaga sp. PAMC20947]QCB45081.1 divalent cation transporter [Hydrogenophaga sp. PAMC20947]
MGALGWMLLWTLAAGACIPLGGWLASVERIRPKWLEQELRHFVMAFGGGVLLAAVALVLLPQGIGALGQQPWAVVAWIMAGGVGFFALERWLGMHQQAAPQLLAMLLDFVPEALALGGIFISGSPAGPLLAVLIGLQNLPEGFNAYREMVAKGRTSSEVLKRMVLLAGLGPLLAWGGWTLLASEPQVLGSLMLFSSGGLLYLVFQDIAPQAVLRRHWFPSLGAVSGFSLALLGQLLFAA